MVYPEDYQTIKDLLINGYDNTELQNNYGFNRNIGIKSRKSKSTKKIDLIIITWNKPKSMYENKMSIETKELKYIGAGTSNQTPEKSNKTLIKRFENIIDCPVIFCSKVGKTLKFISALEISSKGYQKTNIDGVSQYVFFFDMVEINLGNFIELANIKKGVTPTWIKKEASKKREKQNKIKRYITDERLRALIKEMQFIGDLGELVALDYEILRLKQVGLKEYVNLIEHTSVEKGHGYGYDIKSFDIDDKGNVIEIFIEVKSTKLNEDTHFKMTENEYRTCIEKNGLYRIYRVYDIYETGETVRPISHPLNELDFIPDERKSYTCKLKP